MHYLTVMKIYKNMWLKFMLKLILICCITPVATTGAMSQNNTDKVAKAGVFNSTETKSTNMRAFSRWTEMWRRHNLPLREQEIKVKRARPSMGGGSPTASQIVIPKNFRAKRDAARRARAGLPPKEVEAEKNSAAQDDPCRFSNSMKCKQKKWNDFVKEKQGSANKASTDKASTGKNGARKDSKVFKLDHDLLSEVNAFMNRSTYIIDPVNWGVPDYWATPTEFFMKDGDCEDYAISKYITLKRMGVPKNSMRLVIVQDENLRIAHAVLSVKMGDKLMILDNQVDAVMEQKRIHHYRPVYSINEQAWWLHRKQK